MSGIYLHIPFCRKRCTYCDFHFSTTFESYRSALLDALVFEIQQRSAELKVPIQTIYFGGGTPSLLDPHELRMLFAALHKHFVVDSAVEITLEANPEDINEANLLAWKSLGINRLSIGVQTLSDQTLNWMNRAHGVQEALNSVKLAQDLGFNNISIDLIYGLPNLTLIEWEQTIDEVLNLGIQHLSAYCLTIEPKTALNHLVRKKKLQPADETQQSEQFLTLLAKAQQKGFEQYEISNFSLPGFHSKHNSSYWAFKPYIGIGPSAHSFDGHSRRWNVRNNTAYLKGVGKNEQWYEVEELSANECWNEQILLGLRTKWGLDTSHLKSSLTQKENAQIEEFARLGWLNVNEQHIILTNAGKLHADGIAAELFRLD
ncbi:MAG: radical SAM family heme chaperone HemW [Flavobacteriales bacterium]